jgi:L-malate glycosyltransferase
VTSQIASPLLGRGKLRVLHLITRLPVGGAERLIVDIVRHLDRDQFEPMVCCIQDGGLLGVEVQAAGVPLFCLDRMRSKRFDVRLVRELASLLVRERIDVVQSHLYHANLYGRLAGRWAGVPVLATVHNSYTRPKLHRRWLNRLLATKGARVIAVSDDVRRDLVRYDRIPASAIATVNNGVDMSRIRTTLGRNEARERLGIANSAFAIACVARLEEQKGHRYLLDALTNLRDISPRLFLIGEGRLTGDLQAQAARLGVADTVSFLGTRHDIAELLTAMDVYVAPSLWEGLSVALLEAMAAGLPVVATDVGGARKVLGHDEYGLLVPPGDSAALAERIRSLALDSARRAALGRRARQRAQDEFSLDAMIRQLTTLYRAAIAAR